MITRTVNPKLIKKIITHPDVYDFVSDDGSAAPEYYEPVIADQIYYLVSKVGLYVYAPINSITWEVHSCVLPKWRGKSLDYAKASVQWMFENSKCRKVITHVPDYNKRALVYAEHAGFEREGINRMSFEKNGKIYDQILLGVVCQ